MKIDNIQRDPLDPRDQVYAPIKPTEIPNIYYGIIPQVREIENQGNIGSCTGNAGVSALEILLTKKGININLSRLFAYYIIRLVDGRQGTDDGAYVRSIFKAFSKYGLPYEDEYIYDTADVLKKPSKKVFCLAKRLKLGTYMSVTNKTNLKIAISSGLPVVISMVLGKKFRDIKGELSTHISQYRPVDWAEGSDNTSIGGHAMVVVGYDLDGVILENSWGTAWGANGLVKIAWNVFDLDVWDMWTATDVYISDNIWQKLKSYFCTIL